MGPNQSIEITFSQNRNFSPFLSSENYQRMASEVQKLSVGNFDARADGLVAQRWMEAQETRQAVIKHVDSRPLLRERLKVITEKRLPEWINREARHSGRKILSEHLVRVGFSVPQKELTRTAKKLLSVRRYRIAHAIVRADLYLNWRTVVRGSIPKDVPDDLFHVVNASYSDVYATKEIAQGRYAPVVLLDTRVEVYKGKIPIHEWLVTLASGHLPAPEKTPL
jgi:hypothetical protein